MSRRDDVVRRSSRTSHALYKSLAEDRMLKPFYHEIIEEAERFKRREKHERSVRERHHELSGHRYPIRARNIGNYYDLDFDTDDDEVFSPVRQKSAKRRRIEVEEQMENVEAGDDDENSENGFDEVEKGDKMSRSNKRISIGDGKGSEKENIEEMDLTENRIKPKTRRSNSDPVFANNDKKEDESELEVEPRQYMLRQHRTPVDRFTGNSTDRPRRKVAMNNYQTRNPIRRQPRENRKRQYSSSSTGSSDDELALARRDAKDEAAFQRRQLRSVRKNRQRLGPINLTEKELASSKHLFKERLRQLGGTSCTDIDPMGIDKNVKFDQVGGLTSHLQSLKETVLFPLVYPELFETFKIAPPKGLLFYGPPGTGKTLVARALANECSQGARKVAFFMRKGADCLSKWVGESERQLRLLFDEAYSMRPSIIFFDEIDGLAPVRSSRQDQIHSSIVSTLLALMDGLDSRGEVVVIGATNRLDSIDPALRRPGRFDRELAFNLPDKTARQSILGIHTKAWAKESKLSLEEIEWLVEKTSGYCGADLKALCSEAVLVAIRNKFPHIYLSHEKLEVDPKTIKIGREHFAGAMRNIVPACRRDVSIVSQQIHPRLSCLIAPFIQQLFSSKIPKGYSKPNNLDNLYSTELEKVVRALEIPPSIPAARILLHGNGNQGQTHYFLPAIANHLDHLPMQSISCVTVFSAINPEESINQMLHSAIRSTSKGMPTVLLLPDLDVLQSSLTTASWNMLISRLESFVGFTTLLMIGTVRQPLKHCSEDIRQLFGQSNLIEIKSPTKEVRQIYFKSLIEKSFVEPFKFDPANYPKPPKALGKTGPIRKLNVEEVKILEEKYEGNLRHFRIFLREMLGRLIRDRRFNIFNLPVDKEDAEDYYEIIQNPLCLTDMMTKINNNKYSNKAEFLADIQLIRDNAIEYNPDKDLHGRMIRNAAFGLVDMAETLFEEELDEGFAEKLEEAKKMIDEAKYEKIDEKTITQGIQQNGLKEDAIENGEKGTDSDVKRTPKSKSKRRRKKLVIKPRENDEIETCENDADSNDISIVNTDSLPAISETNEYLHSDVLMEEKVTETFIIDKSEIEKCVEQAVDHTFNWSLPQLEAFGAAISQIIDRFTDKMDRTLLPSELSNLISGFLP